MKKYKVYSERNTSKEFTDINEALKEYESMKDWEITNECDTDTYVELIVSVDDFEDSETIRKSVIVEDEDRMAISKPREDGLDFDYWATWKELLPKTE